MNRREFGASDLAIVVAAALIALGLILAFGERL